MRSALASGAAATGATQLGALRAATATLGAGLFAALATIVLGVVMSDGRQVGAASPSLAHAFAASLAGLSGAAVAAVVAAFVARLRSRLARFLPALVAGAVTATVVLMLVFPG